jgi:hypothetical protein
MREEHVGKAAPGLAHRVGAEWRGAHALNAAAHVSNALDAAAAALTVTHSDAVCQCHCHGLGLISLRAARERLHSRSAVLWAVQTRSFRPTADRGAVQTQSFRPTLRIERHHDRFAFGPLSRQHQLDVRVGLTIEISRLGADYPPSTVRNEFISIDATVDARSWVCAPRYVHNSRTIHCARQHTPRAAMLPTSVVLFSILRQAEMKAAPFG